MPRDPDPSLNESTFVHTCLRKGLRLDGRGMYEMRAVEVRFGEEFGWVECRLGGTRVVAQVSAEIVKPLPDRPYEGFVNLVTEISPMASAAYEAGRLRGGACACDGVSKRELTSTTARRASEDEVLMTRLLEKALRRSNTVDREALCIVAGQKVWSIRVDVHFLDDEGNLLDCASIAAMTALRHFRKPDVTVVGEEVTVHSMTERVPVPLAIHHSPMCLTFAFFGDDSLAVLDPSHLESQLCTGTLTLALNSQSEICVLSKQGGAPLGADEVIRAVIKSQPVTRRRRRRLSPGPPRASLGAPSHAQPRPLVLAHSHTLAARKRRAPAIVLVFTPHIESTRSGGSLCGQSERRRQRRDRPLISLNSTLLIAPGLAARLGPHLNPPAARAPPLDVDPFHLAKFAGSLAPTLARTRLLSRHSIILAREWHRLSSATRDPSSSQDRSRSGDGSRSRSSSRTGFAAKTLGAMDIGGGSSKKDDDALGLSRSNSRLLSTSGSPPPAGILLNPVSPTLNGMLAPSPSFSPVYNHSTPLSASTSNLDLSSSTSTTPGARPTLTRTLSDASSSGVSSHIGPTTPSSAHFPVSSSAATPTGATSPPPISSRPSKIRFAPLPEIRPRRYSTGRNVWIVDEEGDDEDGPRRTRLVRVGSDLEDGGGDEFALDDEDDEEEDAGGGRGLMGGKFGSWSETFGGGMWGLSPSTSRRSQDDDARSVTSSVGGSGDVASVGSVGSGGSSGGGGSSSKKLLKAFGLKPKSKSKHAGGDDDSLTRVSSVESQASRRLSLSTSAEAPRPRGSTGIPMRKYASWEVGEAASQNGASAGGGAGAGQAVGAGGGPVYYASPARSARRRANYPPVAQRSRRPAPSSSSNGSRGMKVEEPAFEEWGVGGGVKAQEEASAQKDEEEQPAPESLPAYLDGIRRRTAPGQVPSRSGTIDSTASSASTIRPSTPVPHASPSLNNKPSGLSATRPILSVDVADRREGSSSTASPSGSGSDETPITSPELAREEALAEAAKRSARSMGAERYHSAGHQDELRVLEDRA
uniref:Exosome complex component RRP45 n=1 Tax=Rhodotorula toruloides TaxID=5286 RepID=A0A0K3CLT8_RHOTO